MTNSVTAMHWDELEGEFCKNTEVGFVSRAPRPAMVGAILAGTCWELKTTTEQGEYTIFEFRSDRNHRAYSVVGPKLSGCQKILVPLVRAYEAE